MDSEIARLRAIVDLREDELHEAEWRLRWSNLALGLIDAIIAGVTIEAFTSDQIAELNKHYGNG